MKWSLTVIVIVGRGKGEPDASPQNNLVAGVGLEPTTFGPRDRDTITKFISHNLMYCVI